MDSKQFLKVLAKLIREEVKQAVREEMRTVLAESRTLSARTPHKPGLLSQALSPKATNKPAPPVVKRFQIPGAVGDILNETARAMMSNSNPTPDVETEWSSPEEDLTEGPAPSVVVQHHHPSGDPMMAFVKDYRTVVKAAEAIHNNKYN